MRVLLLAAVVGATAVAVGDRAVQAHGFIGVSGQTGCRVNVTDDTNMTFLYTTAQMPNADMRAAMLWNRTNNVDPTDLNTVGVTTQDAETDVVAFSGDWSGVTGCLNANGVAMSWCTEAGAGCLAAAAVCETIEGDGRCRQHKLYFDNDVAGASASVAYRRALACHETGHATGLAHVGGTCMTDPASSAQIGLGTDLQGHINAFWPGGL